MASLGGSPSGGSSWCGLGGSCPSGPQSHFLSPYASLKPTNGRCPKDRTSVSSMAQCTGSEGAFVFSDRRLPYFLASSVTHFKNILFHSLRVLRLLVSPYFQTPQWNYNITNNYPCSKSLTGTTTCYFDQLLFPNLARPLPHSPCWTSWLQRGRAMWLRPKSISRIPSLAQSWKLSTTSTQDWLQWEEEENGIKKVRETPVTKYKSSLRTSALGLLVE